MRAIALVSLVSLAAGCSAEKKLVRETQKAEATLMEAATTYWEAVRWNDFGTAAVFYEDQQKRLEWMTEVGLGGGDFRYQSAVVLRVEIGTASETPDERGAVRDGTAAVQIVGYKLPKQLLEQRVELQRWYETESGAWFLAEE